VKLVRDRIPELAAATGQPGTSQQATEAESRSGCGPSCWRKPRRPPPPAQPRSWRSWATASKSCTPWPSRLAWPRPRSSAPAPARPAPTAATPAASSGSPPPRCRTARPRRGERPWTCASSTAPAPTCGHRFGQPDEPGRKRRFCSDACKQAVYRQRKRAREQARQQAQDGAHRRAREDARRARDRARRSPPPHAGTSRPGCWCGPAAATAGRIPSTTTGPPTTAPSAAMTVDTPRRSRPGSPRRPPPAGPRPSSSAPSTAWRRRTDRNAPLDRAR
jgi:hypothetical protein